MPSISEAKAAVKALQERREQSRVALTEWPSIEEEVLIVLDAAEKVRSGKTESLPFKRIKDLPPDP